jgi:RimJ/RimL family protein N-acetyltransferase
MNEFDSRVALRDMNLADVALFKDYWYRSSDAFLRGMGVDPNKMKPEVEFVNSLGDAIKDNLKKSTSKLPFLTIELDGIPVGSHSVGDVVEGDTAVFHAHLWDLRVRGIGLCTYTYPRAAKLFMDRFELNELTFKTPAQNEAANRIKEKLGIACCGEEPISYPFMLSGLTAKVYRLSRPALASLLSS